MNQIEKACTWALDTIEDTLDKAGITHGQCVVLINADPGQTEDNNIVLGAAGFDDLDEALDFVDYMVARLACPPQSDARAHWTGRTTSVEGVREPESDVGRGGQAR